MANQVVVSKDLLGQFNSWGDQKREALLVPYSSADSAMPKRMDEEVGQGVIFKDDFKCHAHTLATQASYKAASLAQCVATISISPFAILAEVYRLCSGTIDGRTCLKNISIIPVHVVKSIFNAVLHIAGIVNEVVSTASKGVGFLTWHGGERLVGLITGSPNTVLSNSREIRDIVYNSLGLTLLAAAAVFVPIVPIQMVALPIILGSIYGMINNQFTVRECPEYYTMGHYYDGTDLKGHAVKTNNSFIKPLVTGCYATTMVTKFAGLVLAAAGTIPFTTAILPVSIAGAMIAGTCIISLIAGHLFSNMKKKSIQDDLDKYASLIGIEWNEMNRNKTWTDLAEMRNERIEQKRKELESNVQELERFNQNLQELTKNIESNILDPKTPVKYFAGWQANNTRNTVGYLFAGGGTLAIAISTIFLRLFAL